MNPVESYILKQGEPYCSMMLHIRHVLKRVLPDVEEKFSYKIPFYHYNGKPLCYINRLKGTDYVDVGFMNGALLQPEFPELIDGRQRKRVRSFEVLSLEKFDEYRFTDLLQAAIKIT
ncbi:MAG: DUF1801 domain-containing protein [Flavobacteriaceae bacterium]